MKILPVPSNHLHIYTVSAILIISKTENHKVFSLVTLFSLSTLLKTIKASVDMKWMKHSYFKSALQINGLLFWGVDILRNVWLEGPVISVNKTVCQYPAFDNYSYGSTQVNIFVHNYWCGIAMFLQSNPCGCGAYCQI